MVLPDYRYRGARACHILHARELAEFVATWERARDAGVPLPETDDPAYASLDALLHHVLGAARFYMTWCCASLDLPEPDLIECPPLESVAADAQTFARDLGASWATPLLDVPGARFTESYRAPWGEDFTIDSMLEHALAHPMRHRFQLEELLNGAMKTLVGDD